MIVIEFFRKDKQGKLVVCRRETCYNVFEADELIESEDGHYDHVEITEIK
jgi:hypothetical protein